MTVSLLDTDPPSRDMATSETLPFGFDVSALLLGGESVTLPTSTLRDTQKNTNVAGLAAPTVSGNIITQSVVGSSLTAGHTYWLVVSFQAATGKIWSVRLVLVCLF